ncbi:zinc finger protein 271 isoform X1 [Oreochromis niloticus]|uniref:zinc finger protein 271 isoform X1 n=2 Tax=Oreochromis niloticus TaxID=8128 RepID=UPI0003945F12|nr:zinc finger protein 271 isoform X1 [Oreochromis niloticus]
MKPKHEDAEVNVEGLPQETRVNIGAAFPRWTALKRDKCFQTDAELACFLLDSYERSATPSSAMNGKFSDLQQLLPVKEEVHWSPSLDQQDTDVHHKNEVHEGEQFDGLVEVDITRFPISPVKSEDDDEKPDSLQLHQRPLTSCSDKQMKAEIDGEDCGGPESATDPNPQPSPDSLEMEVSFGDKLQKPETEDSDDGRKKSRTLESGENEDLEFNSANTSFNCSDCGKHFLYRQSLQRHVTSHLEKRTNKKCFKMKQNPDSQIAGHTGEKPFRCNVCEKTFKHQYNLYRHLKIQTGKKPFSCGVCNKTFSQLWDLKRHKIFHTGEKPFNCSMCGKKFTQRMHFKRHMRVHTGERPFGCDVCGKRFNCKRNLKTHMRIHTGEKPYSCDICNKRFSQPGILKRHRSIHTGVKSLRPAEPRRLSLMALVTPSAASELVQTQVLNRVDIQQTFLIKDKFPSSPCVDQQDSDLYQIKAEQEELFICREGEHLNGLQETDITRFPVTAVRVKSEDDEEKPDCSQLNQDNNDSEPPSSCSDKQIKSETDGGGCGETDPDKNQSGHLKQNTDGKVSDSCETEVSIDDDDDWQEPLTDSGPETEVSSNGWKDGRALDSGVKCKRSLQKRMISSSGIRSSCCLANKKCLKVNRTDLEGIQTEDKPFGCDTCGQRFNQNAHLKTHMRIHTGEKPFCCNICEKIFRHQYNLNRHMRVHTGEKPFSCGVCGQKFNRNTNLKTHMRIHTGEKPFGCGLCSKRFSQPGDLKRHKSVHTGEKPFKCSICSKRFTQRIHYKTHMSVHTGERPFGCDLCGKTFNREGNLKIHKRVHTGEKPFGCDICGQKFNQSTNLKTHMRVHSGEKPFHCSICGERFTREGSLRRHMRRQGMNHLIVVKSLPDSNHNVIK